MSAWSGSSADTDLLGPCVSAFCSRFLLGAILSLTFPSAGTESIPKILSIPLSLSVYPDRTLLPSPGYSLSNNIDSPDALHVHQACFIIFFSFFQAEQAPFLLGFYSRPHLESNLRKGFYTGIRFLAISSRQRPPPVFLVIAILESVLALCQGRQLREKGKTGCCRYG